jgi:hypothetical protein
VIQWSGVVPLSWRGRDRKPRSPDAVAHLRIFSIGDLVRMFGTLAGWCRVRVELRARGGEIQQLRQRRGLGVGWRTGAAPIECLLVVLA